MGHSGVRLAELLGKLLRPIADLVPYDIISLDLVLSPLTRSREADAQPTYPDSAERLIACCQSYLRGEFDLASLKAEVWATAGQITIPQERELREFLQHAEGRLDMIQFTVDEADVFNASLELVRSIESRLAIYLSGEG